MHICLLAGRVDRYAGSHAYNRELIRRFAARGHRVTVVCFEADESTRSHADVLAISVPPQSSVPLLWRFGPAFAAAYASRRFAALNVPPADVVFAGEHLLIRPFRKRFPHTPLIYFPMSPVVSHELRNQLSDNWQYRVANRVYSGIQRWALEHADLTVRFTHVTCRMLQESYPDLRPRFRVNPVGVDVPGAVAQPPQRGDTRLLSVGRLAQWKGQDLALKTLATLKHLSWRFDIIGDGECRQQLEKQAVELGLEGRVFFHGFQDDLESWYRQAHLFLFPSRCESLGLVAVDAMAYGVPCLGIKSDGVVYVNANDELIRHRETGLLADNETDFAAQLAYALTSPAELGRLGLAARRQIASENTWEAHIARYEELFGEVLAVRSSRFSA